MRKLIFVFALLGFMATTRATVLTANTVTTENVTFQDEEAPAQSASFTQELKKRFIEGRTWIHGDCLNMFDTWFGNFN